MKTFARSIFSLDLQLLASLLMILELSSFWSYLNIQSAACTKPGVQYLPAFNELSPLVSLRDQVYPPSSFGDSFKIKQFLDCVGTLLLNLLQECESLTTNTHIARSHINEVMHSDFGGRNVLKHIAKKMVPRLGRWTS